MNINPVASGNKTKSGLVGVILTAAVYATLKHLGIDDESGALTAVIVGAIVSGGLTVWGAIHKVIKARQAKKAAAK